jgi:hypothetical protein
MKDKIPKALKEQVWLSHIGKHYQSNCTIPWCSNIITVFDFHCGHNIPESKGGATDISNLRPICSRCNLSMNDSYTIDEWTKLSNPYSKWKSFWRNLFNIRKWRSSDIRVNGIKSSPNPMSPRNKHVKLRGFLLDNKVLIKKKHIVSGIKRKEKK